MLRLPLTYLETRPAIFVTRLTTIGRAMAAQFAGGRAL